MSTATISIYWSSLLDRSDKLKQSAAIFNGKTRWVAVYVVKSKGKGFPYSLPSVGPGADPGVQAVSPQLTISHPPGGIGCHYFPPGGYLPSLRASPPLGRFQVILLGDRGT